MDGWIEKQIEIKRKDRGTDGWMDGRKNGFLRGWISDGWRERLTASTVIFSNNFLIIFPLWPLTKTNFLFSLGQLHSRTAQLSLLSSGLNLT